MLLRLNYTKNGVYLRDHEIEPELRTLINWMNLAPSEVKEGGNTPPAPQDYCPADVFGDHNVINLYSIGDTRYEYEYSDRWEIKISNFLIILVSLVLMKEGLIGFDEIEILIDGKEVDKLEAINHDPYIGLANRLNT